MKKLLILCLLALPLLQSCQKTEVIDEVTQNGATINAKLSLTDATVQNGYLVFESTEHYYNALSEASKMTDSDFAKWANSVGFRSMQVRYNKMLTEYEALGDNAQSLDEVLAFRKSYSDVAVFEETGEVDIKCAKGIDAHLLDTKGMVKIGKDLLIYTPTKEIRIIGGDEAKLAEALHTNTSNQTAGILVMPIVVVIDNERSVCGGDAMQSRILGTPKTYYIYEDGKQKFKLYSELWIVNYGLSGLYPGQPEDASTAKMDIKVKTHKRGLFAQWYTCKVDLYTAGDADANYTVPSNNCWPIVYGVQGTTTKHNNFSLDTDDCNQCTTTTMLYDYNQAQNGSTSYFGYIEHGQVVNAPCKAYWQGCYSNVTIIADFAGTNTSITHTYN